MTQFEYLSVLVSILVGLGLSHLLASTAQLIRLRRRVRIYAPTLALMGTLFLAQVQIWWAAFERREQASWQFFSFVLYLLIPVVAALLSYLVIPDLDNVDEIDLRESHRQNRPWLYGLFAMLPGVSLAEEFGLAYMAGESPRFDLDAWFRLGFLALSVVAAFTRRESAQAAFAFGVLGLIVMYVSVLFVQLA